MRLLAGTRRFLISTSSLMLWLTWPGSFFHELAHQLACYIVGHKVLEVRYVIRNGPNNRAGYVVHQGPPGAGKELLIGIAPLLMGLIIWLVFVALAYSFARDTQLSAAEFLISLVAILVTANATYHALPSPQDMENVFKQPFSVTTIPCIVVAGPLWVIGHNYRCILFGWTPWHAVVFLGTLYVLYNIVLSTFLSLPRLPGPLG